MFNFFSFTLNDIYVIVCKTTTRTITTIGLSPTTDGDKSEMAMASNARTQPKANAAESSSQHDL
jgi:hypothetical protein